MNENFNALTKYCITLNTTPERTKGFLKHIKDKKFKNFGIYSGLHPSKVPNLTHPPGSVIPVPAFLLTLNHYALWNCIGMHPERNKKFLILEDDVVFNLNDYDPVLAALPRDGEFISLGTQRNEPWPRKLENEIAFRRDTDFPCTHAYIITPNVASKMLAYTEETDMWDTIDFYLIKHIYKRINTYVSTWPLIGQRTVKYTTPENRIEWRSLLLPEERVNQ